MGRRVTDETCPVCATADIICGKWTILVIRDLAEGRTRFCELERSLEGISPRTLSLRLRALEEEGIVERRTFPEVPPRVEYALTEEGRRAERTSAACTTAPCTTRWPPSSRRPRGSSPRRSPVAPRSPSSSSSKD